MWSHTVPHHEFHRNMTQTSINELLLNKNKIMYIYFTAESANKHTCEINTLFTIAYYIQKPNTHEPNPHNWDDS
jgi:hypothetical protein